jgi:hypothetical protein
MVNVKVFPFTVKVPILSSVPVPKSTVLTFRPSGVISKVPLTMYLYHERFSKAFLIFTVNALPSRLVPLEVPVISTMSSEV